MTADFGHQLQRQMAVRLIRASVLRRRSKIQAAQFRTPSSDQRCVNTPQTKPTGAMHSPTQNAKVPAIGVLVLAALVGCGQKPPACADPQMLRMTNQIFVQEAQKVTASLANDDPRGILARFFAGTSVSLANVVDNGYQGDTKRQSCGASARLRLPDGRVIEAPISYTAQLMVDKPDQFVLSVENADAHVEQLTHAAVTAYRLERWTGEWKGTYSCGGINGISEPGARGPFTMPVSMAVANPDASETPVALLERTTEGGGHETLEGVMMKNKFLLDGEGVSGSDDAWRASFTLKVNGLEAVGDGKITLSGTGSLRECRMNLLLQPRASAMTVDGQQPAASR